MAEITGFFTLRDEEEITGISRFTGLGLTQFLGNSIVSAPSGKCYVSGSIKNVCPIGIRLRIISGNATLATVFLDGFDELKLTRMPFTDIKIAAPVGVVSLSALGFVTDFSNELDESMFLTQSGLEVIKDGGRNYLYDTETHTDITTATTTTVLDPTDDRTGRLSKVTISTQGANRITLETTDSDGISNVNVLGIINFTAEGSFVYDFQDKGKSISNGINGLVRVITSAATVVDIDVISRAD